MKIINNELTAKGKGKLLEDLNEALEEQKGWLWTLRDVRNQGLHRNLIPKHVEASLHENINTGESDRTTYSLRTNPQTNLEVIPYFEDSFNKIKNLIDDIIRNESSLNT